jgi:hypothetical protein
LLVLAAHSQPVPRQELVKGYGPATECVVLVGVVYRENRVRIGVVPALIFVIRAAG